MHPVTSPTQIPRSSARGEPALTNELLWTDSQWYNVVMRRENAAEHTCLEAKWWQPHHWTA